MNGRPSRLLVSRRFVATLAAAWFLVLAGTLFGHSSLQVFGLFFALMATLGSYVPRRISVHAQQNVGKYSPNEKEPFPVDIQIHNRGRRSLFAEWQLLLPGLAKVAEGETAGYLVLPGRSDMDFAVQVEFLLFGLQKVGPLQLRIEDPFAFTALEQTFGDAEDVRVYPRRAAIHDAILRAKQKRAIVGAYEVAQRGDGFEFFGLRDYAVGDRPRDVNWKASARIGHLIVNQHQKENDAEIVLFVDVRQSSVVGLLASSPFAQSCRFALSIAEAHLRARDAVRYIGYGRQVLEDHHTGATRHIQGILDLVVGFEASGDLPLLDAVKQVLPGLRPRSPVMVFSSLVGDSSVNEAVSLLRSHDFPVTFMVPKPRWGPATPPQQSSQWETLQRAALDELRHMGIRSAHLAPDETMDHAMLQLEVTA
jgi:uncharacterized protein (DUF58 family)